MIQKRQLLEQRGGRYLLLAACIVFFGAVFSQAANLDFHTHSYYSDGIKTPEAMVEIAQEIGLDYYALTDHDTVACLARACKRAQELGVRIIPGVEISAEDDSVHLLSLGIDPSNSDLLQLLQVSSVQRLDRMRKILDKLSSIGVALKLKEDILIPKLNAERMADGLGLADLSLDQAPVEEILAQLQGQITRPDIAKALVAKGYAKDNRDAFVKYIGDEAIAAIPFNGPSFCAVIAIVHQAGGVVVLAHPYTIFKFKTFPLTYSGKGYPDFESFANDLLEAGLDGFEVYRQGWENSPDDYFRIQKIAVAYEQKTGRKVYLTPGSDYHGYDHGIGPGSMGGTRVPPDAVQDLEDLAARLAGCSAHLRSNTMR